MQSLAAIISETPVVMAGLPFIWPRKPAATRQAAEKAIKDDPFIVMTLLLLFLRVLSPPFVSISRQFRGISRIVHNVALLNSIF
jgi:hypothetical protein